MSSTERLSRHFIGAVVDEWQLYSDKASDYTIGAPIGFGASSVVYQAQFQPLNAPTPIPCALKVLDLDRLPQHSLRLLQRETQLMSLSKHPNVLRVRGTWMDGHKLYIALRLMNAGSAADVMHYGWPGGMEEDVVKCILKQALEGINYLHINGFIHRDVKAANLLIDDDGTVLLGDLGVAAFLGDNDDITTPNQSQSVSRQPQRPRVIGKRKSFVGTPCWMAPEVIDGKQYDSSADIWSFGITALELAQGRAPRSREPPHSVLLHIVIDLPPKLDREAGSHKFSRAFQGIIDRCLNKDPSMRPTAAELLQTSFFKSARKKGYLVGTILKGLPPLDQRQERQKQSSILTHRTMDSWDFPTSLPTSPTTSVYSYHKSLPVSVLPSGGVFELEDDYADQGVINDGGGHDEGAAAYGDYIRGHRITSQHAPRPHSTSHSQDSSQTRSRKVSWVEEDTRAANNQYTVSTAEDENPPTSASITPGLKAVNVASEAVPHSPFSIASASVTAMHTQPLSVPKATCPQISPAASGSSYSSSDSASASSELITPPATSTPPSRLWRRLIGRAEESPKDTGGDTIRRKALGGIFGSGTRKRTISGTSSSPGS